MRYVSQSTKFSRGMDIVILVMAIICLAIFLIANGMIGWIAGNVYADKEGDWGESILLQVNFILICLLMLGLGVTHMLLRSIADFLLNQPSLVVDENGFKRFGKGVRRNIYLGWNNIRKIRKYGRARAKQLLRVWIKNPEDAWVTKNPVLSALTRLKTAVSFGHFSRPIEQAFIDVRPLELGLWVSDFEKIVADKMKESATENRKPPAAWYNDKGGKISPYWRFLYLASPLAALIGLLISLAD